ncbi:nucleic acid-binding protein [Solibacillus sp. FSL R7-0682]|uniref:nucleic acid-binding protein n=1 Tax=Solibacillus sp. FSL R7-0682 TaxID=2921690 RepID=UPI0030FA8DC6
MIRNCPDCSTEMEMNCFIVNPYGIQIQKKRKGLFKNTKSVPKAAVCTSCGHVTLYVDNFKAYND